MGWRLSFLLFLTLTFLAPTRVAASPPLGFAPIELPRRLPPDPSLDLNDMTPDGRIAVGNHTYSPRAVRWVDGLLEVLSFAPYPSNYARARSITPDGSVIVGGTTDYGYPDALVWRDGVIRYLPRPEVPSPFATANGVSADGRLIVGAADFPGDNGERRRAARWIDGTIGAFPDPPGAPGSTAALFVSDDGNITVGTASFAGLGDAAVRWIADQPEVLVDPHGGRSFLPAAMTPDGRVLVGYAIHDGITEAVRWEGGVLEGLGDLPGGSFESRATTVTGDGAIVFGTSVTGPPDDCIPSYSCLPIREPFVWTRETGMLPAEEWLRFGCGYDVINWHFGVYDVSDDGTRLATHSIPAGEFGLRHDLVDIGHCTFDYEVPAWITGVGDYYFADYPESAIYRMRRETGEIEQLTAFGEIYNPLDLEIGPDGSLYILSGIWRRIIRFDPATGEQSVVTSGGLLDYPQELTIGSDGTLYAIMSEYFARSADRIVAIDPATGAQSLVSEGNWIDWNAGLTRGGDGHLLTLSRRGGIWWVVRIDRDTGEQTPLVEVDVPAGSTMGAIAYDHQRGQLLARGPAREVIAIHLVTGGVTPVSLPETAGADLEMGSAGDVLAIDYKMLRRIDPDSGEGKTLQAWGHLQNPIAIQEIRAACSDELDNDGDGLADAQDPGCRFPDDDDEFHRTDVSIDISPWSDENWIALGSQKHVEVAVLGSDTVDVRDIDLASLAFGRGGARNLGRFSRFPIFLNPDRHRDLLLSFKVADAGIALGDVEACLVGTVDGVPFHACDAVRVELHPGCGRGFASALVFPFGVSLWRIRRRRD